MEGCRAAAYERECYFGACCRTRANGADSTVALRGMLEQDDLLQMPLNCGQCGS